MQKTFIIILILVISLINVPTVLGNASDPIHAYPRPIPEDTCFETVIGIQPFQPIKYTVPTIGWKDYKELVHINPSGAVVIDPAGTYLAPLIISSESIPLLLNPDNISQKLIDGYMPGVESAWTVDGLVLRQTVFCSPLSTNETEGNPETLITFCRFTVKNQSKASKQFKLQLRFGQVVPDYDLEPASPQYNDQLSLQYPLVMDGNKIKACLLTKNIETDIVDDVLMIDLDLTPGQVKFIDLAMPCTSMEQVKTLDRFNFDERLALFRRFWRYELGQNERFIVPEDRVQDAYRACLAYSMILPSAQSDDAPSMLLNGETCKFVWTFYSTLAYGLSHSTFTTSDVTTDALPYNNFIGLLHEALVLEDGDLLHLLPGSPRGWLVDGKTIEIKQAKTAFGNVNLIARSNVKSGEIHVTVDPPIDKPADIILHIRPPVKYGYIESVTVNGKSWKDFDHKQVHLGKLTTRAEVICRF